MSAIALENKTILVTGAAGFIGSNLVKRICEEVPSAKVVGIDSVNDYYDVALKEFRLNELSKYESFTFIKGNIANKELITEIFTKYKPAVVVNLAAQAGVRYSITNPDAYVEANLIGFYNILEACRHSYDDGETGVEHLVFNHESERRGENFVTRKITLAAGRIAEGLQDHLELGNMDSLRDWGYAKDYVECMWMILQHDASQGIGLFEKLNELYAEYGYCLNTLHSYTFEGSAGFEKMQNIMVSFRKSITEFAGKKVLKCLDYSEGIDGLPKSDVLKFFLEDNCSIVVRPSGTEPKLKAYISVSATTKEEAQVVEGKLARAVEEKM